MHIFWGYTLAEWASVVAILGAVGGLIVWIFRLASKQIVDPIRHSIDGLNKTIQEFKESSRTEHELFTEKLNDHEKRIYFLEHNKKED